MNVYFLYEYLKKHDGHVTDHQIVSAFKNVSSDEIFHAKCLFEDSKKSTICWQADSAISKQITKLSVTPLKKHEKNAKKGDVP